MEDVKDELAEFIQHELQEIITVPAVEMNRNVLRVPPYIRWLNPAAAYEPRLISIGPVFHGEYELRPMEAFKKRYAKYFIKNHKLKIQELIDITKEHEQMLREAYGGMDSSKISSNELVKIMIIDGAFLLEFLIRHDRRALEEMDRMAHKKWSTFTCDLFLLENQIPYSYLHILFHLPSKENVSGCHCMDRMLESFLDKAVRPQFVEGRDHFKRLDDANEPKHFLDFLTIRMRCKQFERSQPKTSSSASCPTISQLHRAGIKFRATTWSYNAAIYFKRGILAIPNLKINENTERYFANLLALELYQEKDRFATDYIVLMDYLIDGPEDVKILVEYGILQNFLDNDRAAADLIDVIGRSVLMHPDFLYWDLVENLNAHSKNIWVKWKLTYLFEWKRDLRRNYFNSPWTTLSVVAAVILLGLTVIQAVCSILQLNEGRGRNF